MEKTGYKKKVSNSEKSGTVNGRLLFVSDGQYQPFYHDQHQVSFSEFIESLATNQLNSYGAVLLDITIAQEERLTKLARQLKPFPPGVLPVPLLALVTPSHDFNSGYPFGCFVSAILSTSEQDTALAGYRIDRTMNEFSHPLGPEHLYSPIFRVWSKIADYTSDWIIIKDLEHRFIFASDPFLKAMGKTRADVLGKNDLEMGSPRGAVLGNPDTGWRGFWAQDDEVIKSGEVSVEHNPNWRLFSGEKRVKQTLRVPLFNDWGDAIALLVCVQDLTEQRENEKMLRDRTAMLSQVTAEKGNAQKHQLIAEEAVAAKNRFMAAASHDLRQPLHAMGLFIDVLQSRVRQDSEAELIKKLKQSSDSLNNLFNSLLDISRLDAGAVSPEYEDIPSASLFENLFEEFRHLAGEKKLQFLGRYGDLVLHSDYILLGRIFRNLVINAIDYTDEGSVTLTCQAFDQVATGDRSSYALVTISDTGPGIPAEDQQDVYNEFHQLSAADGRSGSGFGLGLAIVRRLCNLLSIEIELNSTIGNGTCFFLKIPTSINHQVSAPTPKPKRNSLRDKLIVLIDDDPAICEAMTLLLQQEGCRVLVAESVDDLFESLSKCQRTPDMIIADYELGGKMTGDELIQLLRRELGMGIPALLVTGDTSEDRLSYARECNLSILHKPIQPELLIGAIVENIHRPA